MSKYCNQCFLYMYLSLFVEDHNTILAMSTTNTMCMAAICIEFVSTEACLSN